MLRGNGWRSSSPSGGDRAIDKSFLLALAILPRLWLKFRIAHLHSTTACPRRFPVSFSAFAHLHPLLTGLACFLTRIYALNY